ncbi:MAG: hypothetical protein M1554_00370 [Patescibacteria group bacterium]|jgi:hypothetical protein|nr:hypothetical protein [Patescibacteria group bacterium]
MYKFYESLFNKNLIDLKHFITDLEKKTGHNGEDIRLHNKLAIKLKDKLVDLGLDPFDSSSIEIYHGLINKLKEDDRRLYLSVRSLAGSKVNAKSTLIDGFKIITDELKMSDLIRLKPSFIKNYLIKNPPKRLIKNLHYRTVESLLKRENLSLIVLGINYFESDNYVTKFYSNYKSVKSSDFKNSDLEIIYLNKKWRTALQDLIKNLDKVSLSIPELGSLIIIPCQDQYIKGKTVFYYSSIINSFYEINLYSTYLKYHLPLANFNQFFFNSSTSKLEVYSDFFRQKLSWEVIHHILFSRIDIYDPDILKKEDFRFLGSIFKNVRFSDELKFWTDNFNLGHLQGNSFISFNLLDMSYNLYHNLDSKTAIFKHFVDSMKTSFFLSYLNNLLFLNVPSQKVLETVEI